MNNKKTIIASIIGVALLVLTVVGATFAYFTTVTTNDNGQTSVAGKTDAIGSISLTNPTRNLHITLNAMDMAQDNLNTYWATNDATLNYDSEEVQRDIAVATLTGGEATTYYECTTTINVSVSGTMVAGLQTGDAYIQFGGLLTDKVDLKNVSSTGYPVTFKLNGTDKLSDKVSASLAIENRNANQNSIAGKELTVTFKNDDLECKVVDYRLAALSDNQLIIKDSIGGTVNSLNATLQNENGFNSVNVTVSGKNLFDKSKYINGIVGQPNLTTMYPVSTYGENKVVYIPIEDGETYTISQTVFGKYARYALTDSIVDNVYSNDIKAYTLPMYATSEDQTTFISLTSAVNSRTFINKFNHKYLVAYIYTQGDTFTYEEIANTIQVEPGSVASTYEEHKETTYTIALGETVKEGTIDIVNGVFAKSDGTTITTEKTPINLYEGYNIVSVTNSTNITATYSAKTNALEGKRIVAIGDSMVYGHTLSQDKTWLSLIAERNNMTYVNYGKNGRNMTHNERYINNSTTPTYDGVVDDYENMYNDADYVIVFAGTNDIERGYALGEVDSTNPAEFYGALNIITDGLKVKYPTSKIMFITPYKRAGFEEVTEQYVNAILTVCENKNIPVFDNTVNGGIDWTNSEDIANYTLGDTYHLNENGMELVSNKYEGFLKKIS